MRPTPVGAHPHWTVIPLACPFGRANVRATSHVGGAWPQPAAAGRFRESQRQPEVAPACLRPCLPAALPRFRSTELTGLELPVGVPFAVLHPPPWSTLPSARAASQGGGVIAPSRRPLARRSQAVHSAATMRTMFVSLRKPVTRRSSTVTRPSFTASRIALRTVVSATPTTAARFPTARRQSFRRTVSAATRERTACSASVNRAASPGGSRPDAAQRRRRSIEASVRGREPTVLLVDVAVSRAGWLSPRLEAAGAARETRRAASASVRASIRLDSTSASASVTLPSP